jgi:hypothetical protein
MKRFVLALAIVSVFGGVAQAQSLRSDSPLWTYQNERDADLYPQAFFDDESFGCSVPFRVGDYRRIATTEDEDDTFIRVGNYGVMHCALIYGETYDRDDVADAFEDYAWLIDLGELNDGEGRLLAFQIGVRTGSRYVLLRQRGSGLSSSFEELDWKCPVNAEHRVARIDIWTQDVCVVASKADLRRIASTAARNPAAATWELLQRDEDTPSDDQAR